MQLDVHVYFHSDSDRKMQAKLNEILNLINHLENHMAEFQDFVTQQTAFNASLTTALTDIGTDIQSLNDKIAALTTAPGSLTPEQQAALDALIAEGSALATKADALNALTPPTLPPTEPTV